MYDIYIYNIHHIYNTIYITYMLYININIDIHESIILLYSPNNACT